MKSHLSIFLLFVSACLAAENGDAVPREHPEPITHESLRLWHQAGGLRGYFWPKEHLADLNNDGTEEAFLGLSGYGRGMIYALFTKTKKGWVLLSDEIEGSHHPVGILPAKHESWHDFRTLQPTGRGGLIEIIYAWNGKQYVAASDREITRKELFDE